MGNAQSPARLQNTASGERSLFSSVRTYPGTEPKDKPSVYGIVIVYDDDDDDPRSPPSGSHIYLGAVLFTGSPKLPNLASLCTT